MLATRRVKLFHDQSPWKKCWQPSRGNYFMINLHERNVGNPAGEISSWSISMKEMLATQQGKLFHDQSPWKKCWQPSMGNYFMINLHERNVGNPAGEIISWSISMKEMLATQQGKLFPDQSTWKLCCWAEIWTCNPWICSRMGYWLCYGTLLNQKGLLTLVLLNKLESTPTSNFQPIRLLDQGHWY